MKDSVIIVSGGMDSITLLYDKKDEIALGISLTMEVIITSVKFLSPRCIVSVWESSILR